MRITNVSISTNYLHDVQNNLQKMDKLNTQLNTGQQVNKVSDDPYKAIKIMNMKSEINNVEKYNSNCDEITGWLDTTDGALDSMGNLTSDIKTLLISISGSFGEDEIKAVQSEVNEKVKQIGEALNTTYAGKYIFGGTKTDEQPIKITKDPVTGMAQLQINPNLNNDELKVAISDGITIEYNLSAGKVTNDGDGLKTINEIVNKLSDNPIDMNEIGKLSKDLDKYMNDVLSDRATVGAKTNSVGDIKNTNEENILQMKGTFSKMQDVDFAEKYIELKSAEMIYTSNMQVGAKIIQPTILDYLR
jgi:flagellar hook-associated protein 3 FlgL